MTAVRRQIRIPDYTLGEEIFNAVSHGIGAALSIAALVLMIIRAHGALAVTSVSLFGAAMILQYTVSCIYHALSPRLKGKKVLRVIDHCNVFLLVFGTYIPASLLGVGGTAGWVLFGFVAAVSLIGIVLTGVDVDRYSKAAVVCHLLDGWSILFGIPALLAAMGAAGVRWLLLGGILYSLGAALYGLGKRTRWMHSVFHLFCLAATFCQFWGIYMYLL
ncbi:MAG: hemolysin III family protein [Solobacterium sp.]|nr:hemolysin III family protein [Solobacterium sp.]